MKLCQEAKVTEIIIKKDFAKDYVNFLSIRAFPFCI